MILKQPLILWQSIVPFPMVFKCPLFYSSQLPLSYDTQTVPYSMAVNCPFSNDTQIVLFL